jgi:hypothetical protein
MFGFPSSKHTMVGIGVTAYDPDASLFIRTARINDLRTEMSIKKLVSDLKAFQLWNKLLRIYPFCGGNAFTNSLNLKNPALNPITLTVWRNDVGGTKGDGVNIVNTGLPCSTLSSSSHSIGVLPASLPIGSSFLVGATTNFSTAPSLYITAGLTSIGFASLNQTLSNAGSLTSYPQGLVIGSRLSLTDAAVYANGKRLASTNAAATGTLPATNLWLNSVNLGNNTTNSIAQFQLRFFFAGSGLTQMEVFYLNEIVSLFQKSLGRPA